jgi:hypothetical protein
MDPTAYRSRLARTFAVLALVWSAFNVAVDPFGLWRNRGVPTLGVPTLTWSRVAAAERLDAGCDVSFIGSSRVVFGYGTKPQRVGRRRVCNGALGGTSMHELGYVWDFIVHHTRAETVALFVDLHMFNDLRGTNHDFLQSRFNPDRTSFAFHLWGASSLMSFEMATKAIGIELPIFKPVPPTRASSASTRVMINTTLLSPIMYRHFERPVTSVATLRRILDEAEAYGVRIVVIVPASHAMELEAVHRAGLWELHKDWKRMLVAETSARGVPLWDFGTYHSPALTVLPTTAAEPPNPWWADMSHQSQLLGKLSLERILDHLAGRDGGWEPGFGVPLTPENVEEQLTLLDDGRARWHEEHPEQLAWFDKVVGNALETDPTATDDWAENARRAAGSAGGERRGPTWIQLGRDIEIDL